MNLMQKLFVGAGLIGSLSIGCKGSESTSPNNPPEPKGNPPAAPDFSQIVSLSQEPNRGMHLIIYDASNNEDGFRVERKTQGGSFSQLTNLPANTPTYDDWGISRSTTYTYRIQAYNQSGNSNWNEKTQTSTGPEPGTVLIYPTSDAFVSSGSPTLNNGTLDHLKVVRYSNGMEEAYIKFPYEQIPGYVLNIDKAELRLISRGTGGFLASLVHVEDLASSWNENTVTWNNRPIARGISVDNTYISNSGQPTYWNITPIVRSWRNGTTLNHGIRLFASQEGGGVLESRESNYDPLLTVNYNW